MAPFEAKYLPLGAKFLGKGEFCLGMFFPQKQECDYREIRREAEICEALGGVMRLE